jgi:hypothetical protein
MNWTISSANGTMTTGSFLICTLAALVLGAVIALVHMYRNKYSKNFVLTLVILPAIVQAVIMLVNGNVGTGVAVMGAFSLVRFRSVPGNSREIGSIFLAMAVGLAAGTGYLGIAGLITLCVGAAILIIVRTGFGEGKRGQKELKITIPEDLEYEGLFDELFSEYLSHYRLLKVKTVNMGSLYELDYQIELVKNRTEKEFMDAIRCRNGNLPVVCGSGMSDKEEL